MRTEIDINTPEGAKKYLESEGFNVDELVKEGMDFIKLVKDKIQKEVTERLESYPKHCPITGEKFFMELELNGELVPTYGGPFDSYTIPVEDEEDYSYSRERYCHDSGAWTGTEVFEPDEVIKSLMQQTAALKKEVEELREENNALQFSIGEEQECSSLLRLEIARLRELLQDAANGLQWYYDNHPESNSNVDLEMMDKFKLTLQNQAGCSK